MSPTPTCTCGVKELIQHEITGQPHIDCQPVPSSSTAPANGTPPALNSDALVRSITAALGTNTTITTTL